MPVTTSIPIRHFRQDDFGKVAYEVVGHAFRIHESLVRDWGTGLTRSLYLEAVVALLGGEVQCRRCTQTHWQGIPTGRQPVDMIDDVTAFEITCKRHDEESYESHLQRFLANTALESILWVNIMSGCVMFKRIGDRGK